MKKKPLKKKDKQPINIYLPIKKTLLKEKARLQKNLIHYEKAELEFRNNGGRNCFSNHPAGEAAEFDTPKTMLNRIVWQIRKIDESLKRIREGSYGRCKDCGENIPISRLQVMVFADRCVGCEETNENFKKSLSIPRSYSVMS